MHADTQVADLHIILYVYNSQTDKSRGKVNFYLHMINFKTEV